MRMNTTLVINPKGGAGKTTVAINLASHFAATSTATALMDYDPQGSSLHWLRSRAPEAARIHGANAAPPKPDRLRSFEMYVPPETRQLVIDTPAGASGLLLQEMLGRAHCVIIPVVPSSMDIHATANFIKDLLLKGRIRERSMELEFSRWTSLCRSPNASNSCRSSNGWTKSVRHATTAQLERSTSWGTPAPHREEDPAMMEIDQRVFDLYDEYCHGRIDRRDFLARASAVGAPAALRAGTDDLLHR